MIIQTFSGDGHMRAVLYARVSGDDTKKDGRNLTSQLEMCRTYAIERDYHIIAELHEDDKGASGASFELPQLSAILAMAERHEIDVLVVRELDRLSRNLAKQLIVEETLHRAGVSIEYVIGEYPDTPEGNLSKHIRATIAEFEREKIKERNVRGRRNVVKSGRIMLHGERAPYGYQTVKESRNGKTVIVGLKACESEARIIRLIFAWYTIGDEDGKRLSAGKIAAKLSEMIVPTWCDLRSFTANKKRGHGVWAGRTVLDILHDEVYAGVWYYGKKGTRGDKSSRETFVNPRDTWLALPVPAIVSRETWEAAQAQVLQNRETSERNVRHDYLMRYQLRCACAYAVSCHVVHNNGKAYLYYVCDSYLPDVARGKCGLPNFRADYVDALVWDWLKTWFRDPSNLRQKLEEYKAQQDKANAPVLALIQANEDLIAQNQDALARLLDLYLSKALTKELLIEREMRLRATIEKLETERGKLQASLGHSPSDEDIDNVINFAYNLSAGLDEADKDFSKRRRIIEVLDVRGVLVMEDGERVCNAWFILTGEKNKKRLVLPQRGQPLQLSVADTKM